MMPFSIIKRVQKMGYIEMGFGFLLWDRIKVSQVTRFYTTYLIYC